MLSLSKHEGIAVVQTSSPFDKLRARV